MGPSIARLIQSYPARLRKQMVVNGDEAANLLERTGRDRLSRRYPPASRPGEFPAMRKGRLRREFYAKARLVGDVVVIDVAMPTPYAEYLSARGRLGGRAVIEQNRSQVQEILLRKGYNSLTRWFGG